MIVRYELCGNRRAIENRCEFSSAFKLVLIGLAMLLFAREAQAAASLLDYEKRVFRAAEQVERIKADEEYGDEGIDYIKKLLPKSEQVEIEGHAVKVDNAWLHDLFDSYDKTPDLQKRNAKLEEAVNRLRALDEHLRSAQDGRESIDSKEKIRQILSRSDYREKEDNRITALIKKTRQQILKFLSDLYQSVFRAIFGASSEPNFFFKALIVASLIVAVALAARRFSKASFGKKRKKKRTILGEDIEAGATSKELADAARAAARAGDFRAAIRKLYISLLYDMSERGLIELEAEATNHEYLAKLSRFAPLVPSMRYLTERFDYFWYGMFPSSQEDFSAYLESYNRALERARDLAKQAAKA